MQSPLPKVLLPIANKPMLGHVLSALSELQTLNPIIVCGYKSKEVISAYPECQFVEQKEQLGTGHAVKEHALALLRALPL